MTERTIIHNTVAEVREQIAHDIEAESRKATLAAAAMEPGVSWARLDGMAVAYHDAARIARGGESR